MTNDPTLKPLDPKAPAQGQDAEPKPHVRDDETIPGLRKPGEGLSTGVDTGAIQPGKTQGANLA